MDSFQILTQITTIHPNYNMLDIIFASTLSTILTIVILFALIISAGNECFSFMTVVVLGFIGTVGFLHRDTIPNHFDWKILLYSILTYIPIGLFVALFKYSHLLKSVEKEKLQYHKPSEHKEDIAGWIFFWPFVLIAYVLFDILIDLTDWIFNRFVGIFNNVHTKYLNK
jgi:hypothetical protein